MTMQIYLAFMSVAIILVAFLSGLALPTYAWFKWLRTKPDHTLFRGFLILEGYSPEAADRIADAYCKAIAVAVPVERK